MLAGKGSATLETNISLKAGRDVRDVRDVHADASL